MQQRLYPVWGSTGEYEDYSQWVVGLFAMKRSAEAVAKRLNAIAEEHGVHSGHPSYEKREAAQPVLEAAGDPVARIDYTGIKYHVGGPLRQFVDDADFKMTAQRP